MIPCGILETSPGTSDVALACRVPLYASASFAYLCVTLKSVARSCAPIPTKLVEHVEPIIAQ